MNNLGCRFVPFFRNQHKRNGLQRHEPDTNPRAGTRHEPLRKESSWRRSRWPSAFGLWANALRDAVGLVSMDRLTTTTSRLPPSRDGLTERKRAVHRRVETAKSSGTKRGQCKTMPCKSLTLNVVTGR